jgi:Domain of unknown function (DUF362)
VKNYYALWAICLVCTLPLRGRGQDVPSTEGTTTRSKVVVVEDAGATVSYEPQAGVVQDMVNRGMLRFSGKEDIVQAWRSFVTTQDIVGIKVFSSPGTASGTRPSVVSAVVKGLLAAGVASSNIIIWDRDLLDLRAAGFDELAQRYDVRLAGSANRGYDSNVFYEKELIGNLEPGDYDFDTKGSKTGRKSYVSKLVTSNMTKIITVTPLLNHNLVGVTGHLYSLAKGSVDNFRRFESQPSQMAEVVPEIYDKPALSDHVALCITDALIAQYQGEKRSLLHYATPVNQIWISKDPVALDVLGIEELQRERLAQHIIGEDPNMELYRNAELLDLGVSSRAKMQIDLLK